MIVGYNDGDFSSYSLNSNSVGPLIGGNVDSQKLTANFVSTNNVGAYISLKEDLTSIFFGGISITDSSEDTVVHVSGDVSALHIFGHSIDSSTASFFAARLTITDNTPSLVKANLFVDGSKDIFAHHIVGNEPFYALLKIGNTPTQWVIVRSTYGAAGFLIEWAQIIVDSCPCLHSSMDEHNNDIYYAGTATISSVENLLVRKIAAADGSSTTVVTISTGFLISDLNIHADA